MNQSIATSRPRVVFYARIGREQDGEGFFAQQCRCGEFAAARGWDVAASFADVGSSADAHRPGLDALSAFVELAAVSAVVVTSWDRLTRQAHVLTQLVERWAAIGVSASVVDPVGGYVQRLRAALAESHHRAVSRSGAKR